MTNPDIQMDFTLIDCATKISSFPGTNSICRKDLLCKNYKKCLDKFGEECFNFLPETFNIPEDLQLLKKKMYQTKTPWIVKPPTGFAGKGIRVVSKSNQIGDCKSTVTVQKYLMNPFLIRSLKFDIRVYVLMTSIDPLRIYLYNDGLVRFATDAFSTKEKDLGNNFIHVTNSGVNKNNKVFTYGDDANEFDGHKWSFKTLLKYLKIEGLDSSQMLTDLRSLALKTILCGREDMINGYKNVKSDYNCFKLFGFDVMLDETLKPWLLEVNNFPSFEPESLDRSVNDPLLAELFNLVGFHVTKQFDQQQKNSIMMKQDLERFYDFEPVMYNKYVNMEEQETKEEDKDAYPELIKESNLTPTRVKILIRCEEEISQAVNFSRLNFSKDLKKSDLDCLSCETESDRLVQAWESAYGENRDKGRELLAKLCERNGSLLNLAPEF